MGNASVPDGQASEAAIEDRTQGVVRMGPSKDGTNVLEMILHLNEGNFAEALTALHQVKRVVDRRETDMLRASFEALSSSFAFHDHLLSRSLTGSQSITETAIPSITAQIFGWVSSARLFCDHSLHFLSHTFGDTSPQYARFVQATNWSYDHSVSYRFVDQLRNAFQHVGVPPISIKAAVDPATGKRGLKLIANREDLINYYSWKKIVRDDLSEMGPIVDIYNLLLGSMVQFEFLAGQVRDILRADSVAAVVVLQRLLTEVPQPHVQLSIGRFRMQARSQTHQQLGMDIGTLDVAMVETVAKMPPIPGPPEGELPCIGDLSDDARVMGVCARDSSVIISVPAKGGGGFISACDLHQRQAARWAVGRLGAAGCLHPSLLQYMISGLEAAGYSFRHVPSALALLGLERTTEPLPHLGLDLTKSGWKVSRHPEVVKRTRRAIEALAYWSREGGGTSSYFREIDRLIEDDGSVEPLLTGLVNLSTTLLQNVAMMHGQAPEVILGSLGEELVEDSPAERG